MTGESLFGIMPWHEALDRQLHESHDRTFISDYNGGHPFVAKYLGDLSRHATLQLRDVSAYPQIDEDLALKDKITRFHRAYDGVDYAPDSILPGGGSSSYISTLLLWLNLSGSSDLLYFPPLFNSFAYFVKRLGLRPTRLAVSHAFEPGFQLSLPDRKTVLVFTDPVWYAGRRVPRALYAQIKDWQVATGSIVIVDGTFQYMSWDGTKREDSASLLAGQTIRMVCPTKFLAIHGYRFAYLLMPERLYEEISELHISLHGEVAASDSLFAHRAIDVMLAEGNRELIDHTQANYRRLIDAAAVDQPIQPQTGYFLFARPGISRDSYHAMTQEFFELTGYPAHARINLLSEKAIDRLSAVQSARTRRS